jgi:hypothetical protein
VKSDANKDMINDCIFLTMVHIKKEVEDAKFADQKLILCQCIEHLSGAYKNINYNNMEDLNNESN